MPPHPRRLPWLNRRPDQPAPPSPEEEEKGKTPYDKLMDQLFFVGMTLQGFSWQGLLGLEDEDRLALLERCKEYWEEQNKASKSASRR